MEIKHTVQPSYGTWEEEDKESNYKMAGGKC